MEDFIKNCKSSRIRFDKNFESGDLVLFKHITWGTNPNQSKKKAPPIYFAFIHNSDFPCFLDLDDYCDNFLETFPNPPSWIVGEVVNKETFKLTVLLCLFFCYYQILSQVRHIIIWYFFFELMSHITQIWHSAIKVQKENLLHNSHLFSLFSYILVLLFHS
ncbi:hypothetical protein RFI_14307 [Reticulomyxa filosa]|uniref:Uncharacterized protein n=1 Tax=Reticulomyxa filosa TaxID=46433 RepID=X6NA65_RETFI|nr:hypothetical protein RFI_14307 [Reticulomyxa filosa]|eukprot:ETO22886.1 hypothetical protein RFI_14307 [Reticulomyxa filosa]